MGAQFPPAVPEVFLIHRGGIMVLRISDRLNVELNGYNDILRVYSPINTKNI